MAGDLVVVQAIESAGLSLDTLEGAGWSVHDASARLDWLGPQHARLQLAAAVAVLPDPLGTLTAVSITCPEAEVIGDGDRVRCDRAHIRADSESLGRQAIVAGFDYTVASGRLAFRLDDARYAGGRLAASGVVEAPAWDVRLQGNGLQLAALARALSAAGVALPRLEAGGSLGFTARLQGAAAGLGHGRLTAQLVAESFSDEAGTLAGENLALQLEADLSQSGGRWQVTAGLEGTQGQLYAEPVFLDLDARQVQATASFDWQPGPARLVIHSLDYRQQDAVTLRLSGTLLPGQAVPVESLQLELQEGRFPALYNTYLQPWLNETMLADLETTGRITAGVAMQSGELQSLELVLQDIYLADREARFELGGVTGKLAWGRDDVRREQDLAWDSGQVYRVPLGAAAIATESTASRFALRQPAKITVLDGELQIDAIELDYADGGVRSWFVDGILTPVSMRDLTRALGWPEFAGKLSGVIPDVRYQDGVLEVGGMLLLRVFDGAVTLANLRLAQPFGVIPRLWVDAGVKNIDLRLLTEAFSFGRIEGRLGGSVDGLYMESWRPVAFDAAFATPLEDRSRHRISQKAVDNISSIGGGGVGGALSRSFLRIFEDFPYTRLGIRCRLANGTCDMGGVEAAPNGYYIVKGRLLPPRLDVIGYADRVNWNSLVAQLVAVTGRQGAVVE
jgi:hypothetical protein